MRLKFPTISDEYHPWVALKIVICDKDDPNSIEDLDPGRLAEIVDNLHQMENKNIIISGKFSEDETTLFELNTLCHHLSEKKWSIMLDVDKSWKEIVEEESRTRLLLRLLIFEYVDIIRDRNGKHIDIKKSTKLSKIVEWENSTFIRRIIQRILGGRANVQRSI